MAQQFLRRYPIGIQTFSELVNKHYLYIDKTEYVYRMAHGNSKYLFLSRPRRFGKSLLTSTLHAYFEGRKEIFQGLAIEQLETEWASYPVLHFDMSTAKHADKEALVLELERKLLQYEQITNTTLPCWTWCMKTKTCSCSATSCAISTVR